MPSFLSRIRHHGSNIQPQTHSVPVSPTPASLDSTPNLEAPVSVPPSPLIGLKIRSDLDSLLESYETEDTSPKYQSENGPVTALPPPTRDSHSHLPLKPHISRNISAKSPELTLPVTPGSNRQPTFSIHSPIGGTFGRQQSPLTNLGTVDSGLPYHKVLTRSRSFGDVSNIDQALTGAQRSGRNLTPTSQLPLSGTFKRSASVRSLPDKRRRIDRRRGANTRSLNSLKTNRSSSPATPRPNQMSSSVVHHSGSESPRTFGYPTPPHSTRTLGHHESPPPPLPPLDHPELILDARGSRSTTFDRSHKPSNSASATPHVDNIFGTPWEFASGPSVSHKPVAQKHSKTFSIDSRRSSRRSSAEWSAVQATEGVLTNAHSWQAQVSREILRLSFGEPAVLPGTGDPGNNRNLSHVSATRLPPADFVSPRPSPSLGSPVFLQGQPNILHV